eukprot:gene11876-biopygen6623
MNHKVRSARQIHWDTKSRSTNFCGLSNGVWQLPIHQTAIVPPLSYLGGGRGRMVGPPLRRRSGWEAPQRLGEAWKGATTHDARQGSPIAFTRDAQKMSVIGSTRDARQVSVIAVRCCGTVHHAGMGCR